MISPEFIVVLAAPWALAITALIVFAETGLLVGFFLPGDSLVFLLGMMSAASVHTEQGNLPIWLVCLTITAASFTGDQTGFRLGRADARTAEHRGHLAGRNLIRIQRAHDFLERHGATSIVLARFVPVIRTFLPYGNRPVT